MRKTKDTTKNIKKQTKMFALMGYNKNNEDETGLLAFDNSLKNPYKIVDDIQDAMLFPEKNIDDKPGFGTPKQWLKFFNSEPLLENWKFHLISVKKTKNKV